MSPDKFEHRREHLVSADLAARDIRDERVLGAMCRVPREKFVASDLCDAAERGSTVITRIAPPRAAGRRER